MSKITSLQFPEKVKTVERFELLQTMLIGCEKAWEEAIRPRMEKVRLGGIDSNSLKKGTDFFTEADTESERVIRETLVSKYGDNTFRIFGEESGEYLGNLDAEITIRIDPIDGTEAFKFGKANWSIMIGAYLGRDASERQIVSAIYWPEYYNQILFLIDAVGVFIGNVSTGVVTEIIGIDEQNELGEMIVAFYKHSNLKERGRDEEIIKELEDAGARVKSLMPTEIKEALETRGKRIIILDGDFNEVDFISYSSLIRLGYKIYTWDGVKVSVDDPAIANKRLLFIPPGKAGENVLEIVKRYSNQI